MEKLVIHGEHAESTLLVGAQYRHIVEYLPHGKVIVITDERVRELYPTFFNDHEPIVIGTGEPIKTLDTVAAIYTKLVEKEADRTTFLLGVGGGVVCDIAGFVATTYMRGLRFGFAPTTLLAQVDAAVGGKNGVNFGGFKNRIGTFNQPEFVLCDPAFFHTLPAREVRSGLAEVVKQALIADAGLFDEIEHKVTAILALEPVVMERLVAASVRIKADVVGRDEKEHGERRKLNFGHTVGHAVEQQTKLAHGEAVSVGMAVAAKLSARLGLLPESAVTRIIKLLRELNLPVTLPLPVEKVIAALSGDKKREGDVLHFVLLNAIGRAEVKEISLVQLRELLSDILTEPTRNS